jgi:ribosome silencing factor RsfS/YbeB/iojap
VRRTRDEAPRPVSRVAAPSQQRLSAPRPAKPAADDMLATKKAAAAGPKRARAKKPAPPTPERLEILVAAAVKSLEDDKAENVVVLDVATRSAFADRMIVATGLAERQIDAMARHVEDALGEHGIRRVRREASPDWVLMDAGDIVIHLFKPEKRAEVRLERMWGPDSPPAGEAPEAGDDEEEGDLRPRPAFGDDTPDEDDAMTDQDTPERAPLGGALHPGKHAVNEDARRPGTADGRPSDADDGSANESGGADGRPGAGHGGGAALPRGEMLDGPAGASFEVSGEDMVPTYADEAADEEERATGTDLPRGHDPGAPGRR